MKFAQVWNVVLGIAAVIGWYNAWLWRKYAKRLELYQPRLEIYNAFRKFFSTILTTGNVTQPEVNEFLESTHQTLFFLGQEFEDFRQSAFTNAVKLQTLEQSLANVSNASQTQVETSVTRRQEIFNWFNDSIDSLQARFSKVLDVSK